jgi:hypothetical protein
MPSKGPAVPTTTWQHHRARIAAKRRHHGPTADVTDDLRAMHAAQAEQFLRELNGGPHPPDPEQRVRLARIILTPAGEAP